MTKKKSTELENHRAASQPAASQLASTGAAPARPYIVLARKYRPQTFADLIGQEAMVQTLRNAFSCGRIAHGYMLTGVRGVGKTTTARILARALNYETATISKPTIDLTEIGRHCAEIMESRHPDVIEMDAASNTGVDNIREIIESARYKPILARMKVFIIDEVHMLSKGAFNALLKTLEEPPEHVKFIFATTEVRKVPVTVLSRCQRFDLRRVDVPTLGAHLGAIAKSEGADADPDAVKLIARSAEGSVRDALSILDQAIATSLGDEHERGHIAISAVRAMLGLADRGRIFDLVQELTSGQVANALALLDTLFRDGADAVQVLADLAEAVHVASRVKATGPGLTSDDLSAEEQRRAQTLAEGLSMALLSRLWQMLLKGIEETGRAPNPIAAAEMVIIRIAYTADLPPPDEIIKALGGVPSKARSHAAPSAASTRNTSPVAALPNSDTQQPAPKPTNNAAALDGPPSYESFEQGLDMDEAAPAYDGDESDEDAGPAPLTTARPLNTFADIVSLVGTRRDAKLKVALEDHVSLVKFDAAAGAIDLFLMPGAAAELANELREKLNRWTGRRWMVMLSRTQGETPIGQQRREREAAEIASLKTHPAVTALIDAFPGAQITAIRPLTTSDVTTRDDDNSATG